MARTQAYLKVFRVEKGWLLGSSATQGTVVTGGVLRLMGQVHGCDT